MLFSLAGLSRQESSRTYNLHVGERMHAVCRSSGRDITELNTYVLSLVKRINEKYSNGAYKPVVWLDRPVPMYERIALYSVADVAIVTATRDGMNLVPYEYIVCREGEAVSPCPPFCPLNFYSRGIYSTPSPYQTVSLEDLLLQFESLTRVSLPR